MCYIAKPTNARIKPECAPTINLQPLPKLINMRIKIECTPHLSDVSKKSIILQESFLDRFVAERACVSSRVQCVSTTTSCGMPQIVYRTNVSSQFKPAFWIEPQSGSKRPFWVEKCCKVGQSGIIWSTRKGLCGF